MHTESLKTLGSVRKAQEIVEPEKGQAWCTTLVPAMERQKQVGLCKFKVSLVYIASSQLARATQ